MLTAVPKIAPGIHVDTAVLYNNIGVCLDTLEPLFRREDAIQCFSTGRAVFLELLGPNHPRTITASTSLAKAQSKTQMNYSLVLRPLSASLVVPPTQPAPKRRGKGKAKKGKGRGKR
eukprot:TRINITY_DN4863_c0_g1_i2.p1 TRINITY_DN4863_c0_g1~~TRINITY_DN4863_c0_g1_i2.p1  ORF type:complete len:117 (+),score=36.68 TRINITY_DN4863_c0_g1_i2:124-474(+)